MTNTEKNANWWIVANIQGGGGDAPTGTINIEENGTYNVAKYATAEVNVAGVEETLLWQNPNPNVDFAEQQINFENSKLYPYYKFIYKRDLTAPEGETLIQIRNTHQNGFCFALLNAGTAYKRVVEVRASFIKFSNTKRIDSDEVVNSFAIPLEVYGVTM